jgi:N-acetylmuramoyl-L-alanine amidase CwlA
MKIIQSILTKNPCYKAGRKITVKGLMLHSVGCPQPSAEVFVKKWNSASYSRCCVHAFIDGNTGDVWQCLPWNHRGWHGASGKNGSCNNTHIGVEMCEPACIRYTGGSNFTCSDLTTARAVVQRTYDTAVQLFAHLCKTYGLDPMKDIISHKEGHMRGIASNHGDPEHLWNQLGMGYTMDGFRRAVSAAMKTAGEDVKEESTGLPAASSAPYKVRVSIDNLNIRTGPGTSYDKTGKYTGKGVFTIVETKDGWGKLKSGSGWICLKYAEKMG